MLDHERNLRHKELSNARLSDVAGQKAVVWYHWLEINVHCRMD